MRKAVFVLSTIACLSACATPTGSVNPLVPDKSLQITAKTAISLSELAGAAAVLAAINYIYDPLAPNWEILKRRANKLQIEQGFSGYQLLEYTEGIESLTLGAYRVAVGTVKLVQRQQADSFMLNERN